MGLRSHPEYQEDYWIGDSGASSHMVGEDKDLLAKIPIQGKVNAADGTSMPWCAKVRSMWKQFLNRASEVKES